MVTTLLAHVLTCSACLQALLESVQPPATATAGPQPARIVPPSSSPLLHPPFPRPLLLLPSAAAAPHAAPPPYVPVISVSERIKQHSASRQTSADRARQPVSDPDMTHAPAVGGLQQLPVTLEAAGRFAAASMAVDTVPHSHHQEAMHVSHAARVVSGVARGFVQARHPAAPGHAVSKLNTIAAAVPASAPGVRRGSGEMYCSSLDQPQGFLAAAPQTSLISRPSSGSRPLPLSLDLRRFPGPSNQQLQLHYPQQALADAGLLSPPRLNISQPPPPDRSTHKRKMPLPPQQLGNHGLDTTGVVPAGHLLLAPIAEEGPPAVTAKQNDDMRGDGFWDSLGTHKFHVRTFRFSEGRYMYGVRDCVSASRNVSDSSQQQMMHRIEQTFKLPGQPFYGRVLQAQHIIGKGPRISFVTPEVAVGMFEHYMAHFRIQSQLSEVKGFVDRMKVLTLQV